MRDITTGRMLKNDLTDKKNFKITAIKIVGQAKNGTYFWECSCECGKTSKVLAHKFFKTKSCGCLRYNKGINKKHGLRYHPLYKVWRGMKERCLNKNSKKYPDYGGRGIDMCPDWINSVKNFYDDMSECYKTGLHLDRIDNNKGYYKWNCRWVTPTVNANNKRSNVFVCFDGRTHTPAEWSVELGTKADTIANRKRKGWDDFEVLFGLTNT